MRSAMLDSYASRDPFNDLSRESLTYLWNTMANPDFMLGNALGTRVVRKP
jgi:hypothetical protein